MKGLELSAKCDVRGMIFIVVLYAIGAVSVPFEAVARFIGDEPYIVFLSGFFFKSLCAAIPVYLVFQFKMSGMFSGFKGAVKYLAALPALVVAIDNFPIVPLFSGDTTVSAKPVTAICYVLYCLSIGALEESIFRGNILPLFMYAFGRNKKGTFWAIICSSAIFGAMHLLNLFGGFSAGVFLQVGYSFLIGAMCAATMLFTGNIFVPVIIHSLFDIGGFMFDNFGTGTLWTTPNIIVTAIVSVLCAAAILILFVKWDFTPVYESWGLNVYPTDEERARYKSKSY